MTLLDQGLTTCPHCGKAPDEPKIANSLGFDEFWSAYPRRNGRRVGRAQALVKWGKLSLDDRRSCYRATKKYAAAIERNETIAKDPARFLANGYWRDWLEVVAAPPVTPRRPDWVPLHAVYDTSKGQWVG